MTACHTGTLYTKVNRISIQLRVSLFRQDNNTLRSEMERQERTVVLCILLSFLGHGNCAERKYYIAAVEEKWNYAPTGTNQLTGVSLDQDE